MTKLKNFAEILLKFKNQPGLTGTFAEHIYKNFAFIEAHDTLLKHDNQLLFTLKIPSHLCNVMGNLHGGAVATILDAATTLAILKNDSEGRKSVSIDMSMSFLNPAKKDDLLYVQASCLKVGKAVSFSKCKIYDESTRKIIAFGSHTKAMLKEPFDI